MTFVPESRLAFIQIWVPSKPETGIKEGFKEMVLEFSFGTFRMGNRTTFQMFLCSLVFRWNDLKSGVPFTFQRTFPKLFVIGKQPKAQKLTVFSGFAISFSLELFIAPSNYSQLLNSHLLLLFRRVLFFSALFLFVLFLIAHDRFCSNFAYVGYKYNV